MHSTKIFKSYRYYYNVLINFGKITEVSNFLLQEFSKIMECLKPSVSEITFLFVK